ncbi:MAG: thermonuclease family protein [Humibacter sp.]
MRVVGQLLAPVGVVFAAAFVLSGCAALTPTLDPVVPAPTLAVNPDSTSAASEQITFVSVVDGDTIETSAGTVRIIGIDTPERGECGHDEAAAAIESQLAPGDTVKLELPAGENDQDRYGRLIRYVTTPTGADLGLLQIQGGHAVARYDSSDGYPAHPREADYHAAQLASLSPDGSVITITCEAAEAAPPPAPTDRWWEQYSSCTKLKKNTIGHPTGPFSRNDPSQAEPYEWFANRTGNNGDGDGDGLACE